MFCAFNSDTYIDLIHNIKIPQNIWRLIHTSVLFFFYVGVTHRTAALQLSSTMVEMIGVTWALEKNDKKECSKLLLLLTHLSCIEVRVILEGDPSKVCNFVLCIIQQSWICFLYMVTFLILEFEIIYQRNIILHLLIFIDFIMAKTQHIALTHFLTQGSLLPRS